MKIAFVASPSSLARESLALLEEKYGSAPLDKADVVVAIGGDGLVLKTSYNVLDCGKPVYGLRRTESVGFLCNAYNPDDLPERLSKAKHVALHPLRIDCSTADGSRKSALALNEITFLRDSPQSAKLRVMVDGIERIANYSGDGLLVATPAGSTAYNHSAGGPIMPLDANTLVMTAICGFRPRRWSYAVLPQDVSISIQVLEGGKRPVRIEAGEQTIHHVTETQVRMDREASVTLLFDPDMHLGERIVREQFMI